MTYFDLKGYCFLKVTHLHIKLHLRQMGSYITRFLTFRFLLELVFLVGACSIEENLLFHYIRVEVLISEHHIVELTDSPIFSLQHQHSVVENLQRIAEEGQVNLKDVKRVNDPVCWHCFALSSFL